MSLSSQDLRQSLIDASIDAEIQRINVGTTGNMSVRTDQGMLITPSGIPPRELAPDMIVAMDLDGNWSGKVKPSSEWALHSALYRRRPEIRAVVHAHPDHCVALSCARIGLPAFHYMIALCGGADVRCADYATFGSPELAANAVTALEGHKAVLLANHGVIALGGSLAGAHQIAAEVENLAGQYLDILAAGLAPVILDEEEMARVSAKFAGYGKVG